MITADDYLEWQGVAVPPGTGIGSIHDITPDGSAMCGWAGSPPFLTGWVVQMFSGVKYGRDLTPAHTMDLAGSGGSSLGDTLTVTTSGASSATTFTLLSAADGNVAALGGVFLINLALPIISVPAAVTGGSSTFDIDIPIDNALLGLGLYMQSIETDGGQVAGFAFSNGLRMFVRS